MKGLVLSSVVLPSAPGLYWFSGRCACTGEVPPAESTMGHVLFTITKNEFDQYLTVMDGDAGSTLIPRENDP